MARHKKYEIALAKIENMDLVILLKYKSQPLWSKSPNSYPPNNDNTEAFLCLPKHEAACLNALNGEIVKVTLDGENWIETGIVDRWCDDSWYMSDDFESELIPK